MFKPHDMRKRCMGMNKQGKNVENKNKIWEAKVKKKRKRIENDKQENSEIFVQKALIKQ